MLLVRLSVFLASTSLAVNLVDSASLAESRVLPSSSTRESLSNLLPTSLPSLVMLTRSSSIHSILLVGSLVSSRLSRRLASSLTGYLFGNYSSVSFSTSMSLGMVVDSKGQNPYSIS